MIKRIILSLLLLLAPIIVNASSGLEARVGNNYYDSLEEAITRASSNDTITLISNVELNNSLAINKTVNINLNGNNITAPSTVFEVRGGVLNLTGAGTLKELEPNYGVIRVIGSNSADDSQYSTVNVGKNVNLEGWAGIFITHENSKSYGINVNLEGNINAVDDINGDSGIGIYVNGNIKHLNNSPIINISNNAKITSTGTGIYNAGYTKLNIGNAYIKGVDSGIAIKSGSLTIDGATIIATGKDTTPTNGNSNGVNASGAAIQIESNSGYAGNIELYILSGDLTSKNSYVLYEYIGKGNNSTVQELDIRGGTFISEADKNVLELSTYLRNKNMSFINGGNYSSNISEYLEAGYTTTLENNLYKVIRSTIKNMGYSSTNDSGHHFLKVFIVIASFALLITTISIIYSNRFKIYNFFKK